MVKFNPSVYDGAYFGRHSENTKNYAYPNMRSLINKFFPETESVADFGCGPGFYLHAAMMEGVSCVRGFDIGGENLSPFIPEEVKPFIIRKDVSVPISDFGDPGVYDLVISIETGEHLEPSGSEAFVSNLCRAAGSSGAVVFSAAPPGQEGTGHINMKTKREWAQIFRKHGFRPSGSLTWTVAREWYSQGCPLYITDNLIILINA